MNSRASRKTNASPAVGKGGRECRKHLWNETKHINKMTFPPFLLGEELGTMSKNNLRWITLVRGPEWGIHSLTLIISWCFFSHLIHTVNHKCFNTTIKCGISQIMFMPSFVSFKIICMSLWTEWGKNTHFLPSWISQWKAFAFPKCGLGSNSGHIISAINWILNIMLDNNWTDFFFGFRPCSVDFLRALRQFSCLHKKQYSSYNLILMYEHNALVNGNPHPRETWGIGQLTGKPRSKASP